MQQFALYYLQNILKYAIKIIIENKEGGVILIAKQIRLKPSTIQWIESLAKKEGLTFSAMLRTLLEREEFRDEITKKFDKKRGK